MTWERAESRFPPATFLDVARAAFETQSIGPRSSHLDRRSPLQCQDRFHRRLSRSSRVGSSLGSVQKVLRSLAQQLFKLIAQHQSSTPPDIGLDPCSKATAPRQLEWQVIGLAIDRSQAASAERAITKSGKRDRQCTACPKNRSRGRSSIGIHQRSCEIATAPPRCHRRRHRAKAND